MQNTQEPLEKNKFYGRKKGRPLSLRQKNLLASLLPTLLFKPKKHKAFFKNHPLVMEIGFGDGTNLLHLLNTTTNFVFGIEPYQNGIVKVLDVLEKNVSLQKRTLLFNHSVLDVITFLPECAFENIYILFPDPWPKKRHLKRRLIQEDFLHKLVKTLKENGRLIIASDDPSYIQEIHQVLQKQKNLKRLSGITNPESAMWPPWPKELPLTPYACKALNQKKTLGHFILQKTPSVTDKKSK